VNLTQISNLIGKPIPISPSVHVHHLYPTITMWKGVPLEANFGDDPVKPFSFEVNKFPQFFYL
jgi:hypothetical protein